MKRSSRSWFVAARPLVAGACALVSVLSGPAGWAREGATCLAAAEHATPAAGTRLRIGAGTTYAGTITITSDSVTIDNYGTLAGTIVVSSGVRGTVLNNLGSVTSETIYLNAPTTINNGSATVPTASWTGYIGDTFGAAPTINNFALFSSEIFTLPGGAIRNRAGATWQGYIHNSAAALAITNEGTWQAPLTSTGSLRVHNTGHWLSRLDACGPAAISNKGTWK
ncbi:MAG TPA: hypothetical protein VFO93_10555 [Hymenobacter sp.]|uniref:hypothetical protein n=1 Tax=Hymenobacter sp. TaxID=1898978 RepID=UPI002D7F2AD1|nr:hypothetical protein [Hymenobacter sp.]HET9503974.1 hypothetical protein [Hymenobacter sp.]